MRAESALGAAAVTTEAGAALVGAAVADGDGEQATAQMAAKAKDTTRTMLVSPS